LRADTLFFLGLIRNSAGKYLEAKQAFHQALTANAQAKNHSQIAVIWIRLINVLCDLGRYDEASGLCPVAEVAIASTGDEPAARSDFLLSLAGLRYYQGSLTESIALQKEAIELKKKHLPPDHPDLGNAIHNLGTAYLELKKLDQARECFTQAAKIFEKSFGPKHPRTIAPLYNNGLVLMGLLKFRQASEQIERVLPIIEQAYGANHPTTGTGYFNLGNIYFELGEYQKARQHLERAQEIWIAGLGPEHPDITRVMYFLGLTALYQQQDARAQELLGRALTIRKRGPDSPPFLNKIRFALARALWRTGKDRKRALALARQARLAWEKKNDNDGKKRAQIDAWQESLKRGAAED